jgi:hypothetical protein
MEEFNIEIKLCSETIFGSGESVPGSVDLEIVHDEYGIPYFKGKTFKGKLREKVEQICEILQGINKDFKLHKHVDNMFGEEGENELDTIKFSDCILHENVIKSLIYGINKGKFTKEDVKDALTDVRTFTSIDKNGIAKDGSLREVRVVKKGFNFISNIIIEKELEDIEKGLLAAGVSALRNIGTMESRGKGLIDARLIKEGKDITKEYISLLEKEVKKHA